LQGFLLAILVLSVIIPIGMSDAFGAITDGTVTFVASHELTNSGNTPRYFDFNEDGTVLIIVEGHTDKIEEYTLSTGYDLTTLSYSGNGQRFNSHANDATGDGQPRGMEFNDDGTIMFVIGNVADEINQYALSTGFDVSTASFTQRVDITTRVGTSPHGVVFNGDGTQVSFNNKNKIIKVFDIDAFDVKPLGTEVDSIDLSAHLPKSMRGMEFNDDGTKFFVVTNDGACCTVNNKIHEFTLSTAYDISSYTYVGEFDVNDWETDPQGLGFNPDGTRMYVLGQNKNNMNGAGEFIHEFALSCGFQFSGTCGEADPVEEEEEEKQRSGACGFDRDCTPPRITNHGDSETPDGFSINNNIFMENQELFNKNPMVQGIVGEPVTIKVRAWENMGTDRISLAIAYLAMHDEKPDWRDSTANIEFSIQQDEFKVYDKDKIFSAVGAVTERIEDPYGDNPALELLDITFTLIFAKPMESSHIGIQTIDDINNYDLVYFENALEILPKEIVQVEEIPEVVPEKVPESLPEVVPEEIPEPEPPVKEPEPEVMLTAIDEKTVLEFVDENISAKHYVKRYITETEYKEWFDVNYSEYKFWEGIGITQERFDELILEIESEPEPKMIQTGFVFVPEDEKSLPLVEQTYEPEPPEPEPVKQEKKGFFDWLFDLFN